MDTLDTVLMLQEGHAIDEKFRKIRELIAACGIPYRDREEAAQIGLTFLHDESVLDEKSHETI
jgi:hypothetical protein